MRKFWEGSRWHNIVHGFVPRFSKTEKIQFIVKDKFPEEQAFIVE